MGLRPPTLEHLMTVHLDMVPGSLLTLDGVPAGGGRWSIGVAGGTFEGPRLRGRVLPGGIENPQLRPDHVLMINARWWLETDDGAHIYVQNRGIRRAQDDPAQMEAWLSGDDVAADDFYFRVAPTFETAVGEYDWLTRHLFVGVLVDPAAGPEPTGPSMQIFTVR